MAADETYELEFIVFDQKAQQLIGKPIQRLKSMYDKYETPPEISDLIGQRYTFVVKISSKKASTATSHLSKLSTLKSNLEGKPIYQYFERPVLSLQIVLPKLLRQAYHH